MNWQCASLAAAKASPWRNGGGVTRELLAWPDDAWRIRISVADIESDGAFSTFPGIERWFAVLEGQGGVELQVGDSRHRLDAGGEPLRFDGAASVFATLVDGRTRDFNLMAPPGAARMRRVRGTHHFEIAASSLAAVYAHTHSARVRLGDETLDVPPATLAWCRLPRACAVAVDAQDALFMEVAL